MVQWVARREHRLRGSSHALIVDRRQQQRNSGIDPVRRWQCERIVDLQPSQRIVLYRGTRCINEAHRRLDHRANLALRRVPQNASYRGFTD